MKRENDRADDILYTNSDGTKAKIAFIWGKKKDTLPKGLDITIKLPDRKKRDLKIHCRHRTYKTLAEARNQAVLLSEGIVDLLNQPFD